MESKRKGKEKIKSSSSGYELSEFEEKRKQLLEERKRLENEIEHKKELDDITRENSRLKEKLGFWRKFFG